MPDEHEVNDNSNKEENEEEEADKREEEKNEKEKNFDRHSRSPAVLTTEIVLFVTLLSFMASDCYYALTPSSGIDQQTEDMALGEAKAEISGTPLRTTTESPNHAETTYTGTPQPSFQTLSPHVVEKFFTNMQPTFFIGGLPHSGGSLLRAMVDAHGDIRCGDAVGVVQKQMSMWRKIAYNNLQIQRMKLGGVKETILDKAMTLFLLEILGQNGPHAPVLCIYDPLSLVGGRYLLHLFPYGKSIFILRDTRAVVMSAFKKIKKKREWEATKKQLESLIIEMTSQVFTMRKECYLLGPQYCLPVHYEALVLRPRETMERILEFMEVDWSEDVLRHYLFINKTGVVSRKNENITLPVYEDSLTTWVGELPDYLAQYSHIYFPQLQYLGYDPHHLPPDYTRLGEYSWAKPNETQGISPHMRDKKEFNRIMARAAVRNV